MMDSHQGDQWQELNKQFTDIMNDNEKLVKQNRLFQACLARMELEHKQQDDDLPEHHRQFHRHKHREHLITKLSPRRLMDLAQKEKDYRTDQLQHLEESVKGDISLLKAITEATKIRINEMRKEAYEFKRDIVVGGANARTGKIMAEKVIRYFEDKIKQKINLLEKMNGKNNALKIRRMKMDIQVAQKKNQKDNLCTIDFHQLQIKNSQFNTTITERNNELVALKKTTSKTVQTLRKAQTELNKLLADAEELTDKIAKRKKAAQDLEAELKKVEEKVRKERKRNRQFKIQQSNPDMPQVLDYVTQKSDMYELQAAVRNWERKVEIIQMASKRARATIRRIELQGYHVDEHGSVTYKEGKSQGPGPMSGLGGMRGRGSRGKVGGPNRGLNRTRQINGTTLPPIDFAKSGS